MDAMNNRASWQKWVRVLGIALLVWLLSQMSWKQIWQAILALNPAYLAGYLGSFLLMTLVRTIRLHRVAAQLGYLIPLRKCSKAILEPALIGMVTPGRIGEFSRVGYFLAEGMPLATAVSLVTLERLIDLSLLLVFGLGGLTYILAPNPDPWLSAAIIGPGLGLILGAFRGYGYLTRGLQSLLRLFFRRKSSLATRIGSAWEESALRVLKNTGLVLFSLGLVCLLLNFLQVYLLAGAFGFQADRLVVVFAYTSSALVSLLPVSVGGLGTREATYITILHRQGIRKEQALLFSLLDGFVLSLAMIAFTLGLVWLLHSIFRKKRGSRRT